MHYEERGEFKGSEFEYSTGGGRGRGRGEEGMDDTRCQGWGKLHSGRYKSTDGSTPDVAGKNVREESDNPSRLRAWTRWVGFVLGVFGTCVDGHGELRKQGQEVGGWSKQVKWRTRRTGHFLQCG